MDQGVSDIFERERFPPKSEGAVFFSGEEFGSPILPGDAPAVQKRGQIKVAGVKAVPQKVNRLSFETGCDLYTGDDVNAFYDILKAPFVGADAVMVSDGKDVQSRFYGFVNQIIGGVVHPNRKSEHGGHIVLISLFLPFGYDNRRL